MAISTSYVKLPEGTTMLIIDDNRVRIIESVYLLAMITITCMILLDHDELYCDNNYNSIT